MKRDKFTKVTQITIEEGNTHTIVVDSRSGKIKEIKPQITNLDSCTSKVAKQDRYLTKDEKKELKYFIKTVLDKVEEITHENHCKNLSELNDITFLEKERIEMHYKIVYDYCIKALNDRDKEGGYPLSTEQQAYLLYPLHDDPDHEKYYREQCQRVKIGVDDDIIRFEFSRPTHPEQKHSQQQEISIYDQKRIAILYAELEYIEGRLKKGELILEEDENGKKIIPLKTTELAQRLLDRTKNTTDYHYFSKFGKTFKTKLKDKTFWKKQNRYRLAFDWQLKRDDFKQIREKILSL